MAFPDPVVVAVDGSDDARAALTVAARLTATSRGRIHLVHVAVESLAPHTLSPGELPAVEEEFRSVLDEMRGHAQELGADVADAALRSGSVEEEIVALCEQVDADLLVVGTRGHGAVTGALVGSTSQALVGRSPCPVLVVSADRS